MKFELFRDRKREWRWRLRARNDNIIATSGESYKRRQSALHGIHLVREEAPGAYQIIEVRR